VETSGFQPGADVAPDATTVLTPLDPAWQPPASDPSPSWAPPTQEAVVPAEAPAPVPPALPAPPLGLQAFPAPVGPPVQPAAPFRLSPRWGQWLAS